MPDPYELDDEGRPVAEAREEEEQEPAEGAEPAEADAGAGFSPIGDDDSTVDPDPTAEPTESAETGSIAGTEPVADPAPAADPTAEEAAMRRQIETTLRFMRLQTIVGVIVILALIAFLSDIRGVLVLVLVIFAFSSAGAYWWLRRSLNARLGGGQ